MDIPTTRAPTLYERVGGDTGITDLVGAFSRRVLADPLLAPFFGDASVERLQAMQIEFFGAALGGPQQYAGPAIHHVHRGRGIGSRHLTRFVELLVEAVGEVTRLDRDDVDAVVARITLAGNDVLDEQPDVD
jgi:hemoglobin